MQFVHKKWDTFSAALPRQSLALTIPVGEARGNESLASLRLAPSVRTAATACGGDARVTPCRCGEAMPTSPATATG